MEIPRPHVPPRRQAPPHYTLESNPEQVSSTEQLKAIPWVTLIATTAATTLTGYVLLEAVKLMHARIKNRSKDGDEEVSEARKAGRKAAAQAVQEARNPQLPPGAQRDGTFQLPVPDGPPMRQPPAYPGFAQRPQWPPQRHAAQAQRHLHVVPQNPGPAQPSVEDRLRAIEDMLMRGQDGEVG